MQNFEGSCHGYCETAEHLNCSAQYPTINIIPDHNSMKKQGIQQWLILNRVWGGCKYNEHNSVYKHWAL